MAWNSTTKILSRKGGYTAVAESGAGDLQLALRSSRLSKQDLFAYGLINPHAKYKAFKSATACFATAAARDAARLQDIYGFTTRPQFLPASNISAAWSYTRPATPTYALRVDDFVHGDDYIGYQQNAAPCFGITVGQMTKTAQSQILLWLDDMYNYCGAEANGREWRRGTSLSIADLFNGYMSYYFAFVIMVGNTKNVILTNKTLNAALNDDYGSVEIDLYAGGDGSSNTAIPVLQNAAAGSTVTVIAYLTGSHASSGNYEVKTSSLDTYGGYSLAIESGIDRTTAELTSGAFRMDGTTMGNLVLNAVDTAMEMTDANNQVWRAFLLELSATFSTENVPFSGTMRVSGNIKFLVSGGAGKYGATPDEAQTPVTEANSVTLVGGTAGQTKAIASKSYFWVLKQSGSLIQTTAKAEVTYDTPFSASSYYLTGEASKTINP